MSGGSAFPEWAIGVILIIIGSLGNNLGNNLVSLGHQEVREVRVRTKSQADLVALQSEEDQAQMKEDAEATDGVENKEGPNWRKIGTIVFIVGNLCTFGAFGFGAQSLIASLESIQFVSNVVFAKYVHKEPITNRMIISTLAILGGNVLVIIFSSHSSDLVNSTGMIRLYEENTLYHIYMVLAFALWAVTSYIFKKYHHSRTVLRLPLLYKHNFLEPFCYAVSSAIIGTQAVLNSKCMSILIQVSARERNEFSRWYIYLILVTWLILVAYWLKRLDWGLELFPPLFIIPVMQVFFVLFAVLCGGIYFEEFNGFSALAWAGFVSGIVMILGGVYGLAPLDMQLYVPEEDEGAGRGQERGGEDARVGGADELGASRLENGSYSSPGKGGSPHKESSHKQESINSKSLESKIARSFPFFDEYFDYFTEVTTSPVRGGTSPSADAKLKEKIKPEPVVVPILVSNNMPHRGKVYLEPLQAQAQDKAAAPAEAPVVTKKSNRRLVTRNAPGVASRGGTPNGRSSRAGSMDASPPDTDTLQRQHSEEDKFDCHTRHTAPSIVSASISAQATNCIDVPVSTHSKSGATSTKQTSIEPTRPNTVEDSLVIPYDESEPYDDDDNNNF